jgi:thiol-disulfide isomerase/thioredoxin
VKLALLALAACASNAAAPPPRGPAAKYKDVTGPLADDIEAEHVTLVDFWADWCAACDEVAAQIDAAIKDDARIVVRKVDIGDATSAVAREHKVSTLPHWQVYDRSKQLRYVLIGNEVLRAPTLAAELLRER